VGGVLVEKLVGRGSGITRSFDRRSKSSGTLRSFRARNRRAAGPAHATVERLGRPKTSYPTQILEPEDTVEPLIDHIQITVKDMSLAEPFYEKLLPLLGFDASKKASAVIAEHEFHVVEWKHPRLCFAITSPRSAFANDTINRRRPGALHHLAFKAASRAEVDRLHEEIRKIGATIVRPPQEYPEYTPPGYYACYFKDLDGIKYEIVFYPGKES
jgi:catechol 2,3-dioxygenase-like lactoylglutathione lyase family enzyme